MNTTKEEVQFVKAVVAESPLYKKWGDEEDIFLIIDRIKKYVNLFSLANKEIKDCTEECV